MNKPKEVKKLKYKILQKTENNIKLFCLYDDNTFAIVDLIAGRELEEILQDAYILTKNVENRKTYDGDKIEDPQEYIPEPRAARFDVDFYKLTGEVYNQYGDPIDVPIDFEIEGTDKVIIEDGKLVGEIEEAITFFIVARVGDLEQKYERSLYPEPKILEPDPEDLPITRKEYNELLSKLDEQNKALQVAFGDIDNGGSI